MATHSRAVAAAADVVLRVEGTGLVPVQPGRLTDAAGEAIRAARRGAPPCAGRPIRLRPSPPPLPSPTCAAARRRAPPLVAGIALGVAVVVAIDLANASALAAFRRSAAAVTGRATHRVVGRPTGIDARLRSHRHRSIADRRPRHRWSRVSWKYRPLATARSRCSASTHWPTRRSVTF
ncbi:MAG: hypothetical protein IPG72_14880 [Ardenticatenales bacterium]|nr:hypothetical protein [Ardenticatenales bacterium]